MVRIARIDRLGEPTWLLMAPKSVATKLVSQLEARGVSRGNDIRC